MDPLACAESATALPLELRFGGQLQRHVWRMEWIAHRTTQLQSLSRVLASDISSPSSLTRARLRPPP